MQSITIKAFPEGESRVNTGINKNQPEPSTIREKQSQNGAVYPAPQDKRLFWEQPKGKGSGERGDVYDQDQKSPGLGPHDAAYSQQQYRGHHPLNQGQQWGTKSQKRGVTESQLMGQADSLREKAIRHCLKQEYFDVLTYTHRCSKLILQLKGDSSQQHPHGQSTVTDSSMRMEENLRILRRTNESAFLILKDCLIYSSIAYIQLQQYDQAVSLTTPLIDLEDLGECADPDHQYIVPALLIRAQAKELMGQEVKSLTDLENGQRLQPDNQIVKNQIDRLKAAIQEKQLQQQKSVEIKRKDNRSKSSLLQKNQFKNQIPRHSPKLSQLNQVKKIKSEEVNSQAINKLRPNHMVRLESVREERTVKQTLKTPEKRISMDYEIMETQATQNKSLHPATPSQIKFDFDEDGQYSSDGTKQQQEVLNYLMLGAKQKSQQKAASKAQKSKNEKLAPISKVNLNQCQLTDGYSADTQVNPKASPKFSKATGKGPFKTQQLDMVAQIVLLLRQLCRYISKNKWLQLLLVAVTTFYAFMCYRLVRYFHALMKKERVIGTVAYRPQDLSRAICHYIMLVLDQTFKRLQK